MGDRKVVRESESHSVRQDWYSSNGDIDIRQQIRDRGREGQHGGGCGCCSCGCATKLQDEFQRERVGRVDQSQGSWRTDENQRGRFNQPQNNWRSDEIQRERFLQSQKSWRTDEGDQGAYSEGYRRGYEAARAESQACFGRQRTEADDVCNVQTKVSRLTYDDRDKRFTPLYQTTHEIARQRVMAELQRQSGISMDGDRNCQPDARGQWRRDSNQTRTGVEEEARYRMQYQELARQREQQYLQEQYLREQETRRQQDYLRNIPEGCSSGGRSNNDRMKRLAAIVGSIVLGGQPRTEYFDEPRRYDNFSDPASNPIGRSGCNDGVPRYSQWNNSRPSAVWQMSYPNQDREERRQEEITWQMHQQNASWNGAFRNNGNSTDPRFQQHYDHPGMYQPNRQNFPGSLGYQHEFEYPSEFEGGYAQRNHYPATEQQRKVQQIRQWTNLAGNLFSKFNH